MKITIITPFPSEKDSRAQRLSAEFKSLGDTVDIISTEPKKENHLVGKLSKRIHRYLTAIKEIKNTEGGLVAVNCEIALLANIIKILRINKSLKFIIVDVYDHHGYIFNGIPAKIFSILERLALIFSDAAIIPIQERLEQYNPKLSAKTRNKIEFISNIGFAPPRPHEITKNKTSNIFKIIYAGTIDYGRGLHAIIETAKSYPDEIEIEIYGNGPLLPELLKSMDFKKIYRGGFKFHDLAILYSDADLIFAFYELIIPNHKFCDPNKLREVFEFNKPVLTNAGTPLSKMVESMGIGIVINEATSAEIISAARCASKSKESINNAIKVSRDTIEKIAAYNKDSAAKILNKFR